MSLLIGALTMGSILALMALGVFLTFRIFGFADLATDSILTLGAATAAVLMVRGASPVVAMSAATVSGMLAGGVTGLLHTRLHINNLLSGILVMTGLYSVNLRIMGGSNVSLSRATTVVDMAGTAARKLTGLETMSLSIWEVPIGDLAVLAGALLVACLFGILLRLFFLTDFGIALRASGDNGQSALAQGVSAPNMLLFSLMLAGGFSALTGSLLAQYQGFADVQMGVGTLVLGLASVIMGQALVRSRSLGVALAGTIMGSVLFRLLVSIALRWGLNPNDLKIITALFVLVTLILPNMVLYLKKGGARRHA
ncbi:ABC transporter permease [Aminirod propionatiphilus]|uniref:ABC transporter permease n=1 Tax=Aminirod propionatiphilus TaxID=3415223 RepID=A0ACD1DZA3_9BACT|nr:ABC transporter permease [Synergistota bacterium]